MSESMPPQPSAPITYTPPGETFVEKAKRKTLEEPLVPMGVFATVVAVSMATRQFRRGDRTSMNHWLRVRVAAQGFTVLAICTYGFALRWRKKNETEAIDTGSSVDGHSILRGDGRGSIVGNVQVTPAALLREAAKEKEKGDFERRLEEAIVKDRAEQEQRESGKEKPDWKAAWKEGLLQKNRENDARRVKPTERKD